MIRVYFMIVICWVFISSSAFAQDNYLYKLDIPLNSSGLNYSGDFTIMTGPASLAHGRKFKIGEVQIILGIDKMSNIVFYSSDDSDFLINNFRYLSNEQKYLDSMKKNCKLIYEEGWAAYIPIAEGWNLAFHFLDVEQSKTNGYILKKEAKPTSVFKRSNRDDPKYRLRNIR